MVTEIKCLLNKYRTLMLRIFLAVASITLAAANAFAVTLLTPKTLDPNLGLESKWMGLNIHIDEGVSLAERAYYCAAAAEGSRQIWEMTGGQWFVNQVVFSEVPANEGIASGAVRWARYDQVARASVGGDWVRMFDAVDRCNSRTLGIAEQEGDDFILDQTLTCQDPSLTCFVYDGPLGQWSNDYSDRGARAGEPLPNEYVPFNEGAHGDNPTSYLRASVCADSENRLPIRLSPAESGWILTHEINHSDVNILDEYGSWTATVGGTTLAQYAPVCFGHPLKDGGLDETSVMGVRGRAHYCSHESHDPESPIFTGDDEFIFLDDGVTLATVQANASYNTQEENAWNQVVAQTATLWPAYPHLALTEVEPGDAPAFPDLPNNFCVWPSSNSTNDLALVVDRSGSMSAQDPVYGTFGQTALKAADNTAKTTYTYLPKSSRATILRFNQNVSTPISLDTPDPALLAGYPASAPGGDTDLCEAIETAAAELADGNDAATPALVLMTDGLPTVDGCNTAQAVRDSALAACSGEFGREVVISTLAFGDADAPLLSEISNACGADGVPLIVPSPYGNVARPQDISVQFSRLQASARRLDDLGIVEGFPTVPNDNKLGAFYVPDGAGSLEHTWSMDGSYNTSTPNGKKVNCSINLIKQFYLVDPKGKHYPEKARHGLNAGVRVDNPQAGTWKTMMNVSPRYDCLQPDTQTPRPVFKTTTAIESPYLARLTSRIVPAYETARIELHVEHNGRVVFKGAAAKLRVSPSNGGASTFFDFRDDGLGADKVSNDGVLTASVPAEPVGTYALEAMIEMGSDAAYREQADFALTGAAEINTGAVSPAKLFALGTLIRKECPTQGCVADGSMTPGSNWPSMPSNDPLGPCGFAVIPGKKYRRLYLDINGVSSRGASAVAMWLGPDVDIHNLRRQSIDNGSSTRLFFDAHVNTDVKPRTYRPKINIDGRIITGHDCAIRAASRYK